MPRFSSNDMVHNHYLEEAKKKTHERDRNSKTSVMSSARLQNTTNGSKPKPRITNQMTRNWPTYKSSCVTKADVPKAEHSRNSSSFWDSKRFVCSTYHKCVFNANHDACITNLLKEVNSHTKVQSHKTTKRYIPVAKKIDSKKPERRIPIGQKFYPNKTSAVYVKTTPSRSGLTWKPAGRIFTSVGLRWILTGKTVETCLNTNDSAIPLGKETCSPKNNICANSSYLSADVPVIRTRKYGESNASALEDLTLQAGNLVKEISRLSRQRLLASFQDDAKYEHVGQDTRSQDGKDDKDIQGKDLKISELKSKSVEKAQNQRSHSMKEQSYNKDNDQDYKSLTSMQSQRLILAGALQYLTFTHSDISYAMQQVCLYIHDPRKPCFLALKRILRYVLGTLNHELQSFSSSTTSLVAYSYVDWAGCSTTRRSTSGYCVFIGNNLLSWSSKRQPTLSRSSTKAEYCGVVNVVVETCWLRNLLR
ncbi:actin-binding, cofilin/tropomyosin type protein [Tanacetum coccineum]|uniref:Actin-binding, cofilin/tropomyosin type protein n=1 Tax=Tanacetum coccineum TaxID=301880 RepID=A0ABQ5GYB4_9ASTR